MPATRVSGSYNGSSQLKVTRESGSSETRKDSKGGIRGYTESNSQTIEVTPELIQRIAEKSIAGKESLISNFAQSQRHNFRLSNNQYSNTFREFDGVRLNYTSMNGVYETIQAQVNVTEQMIAEEYYKEQDDRVTQEGGEEQLVAVVFTGGNKISYIPMATFKNNPNAQGSSRTFNKSSWGTDIIKTCQLQIGKQLGAIYSELNGIYEHYFFRGSSFVLTTSMLADTVTVQTDAVHEYPIMAVNGNTAHVGIASATFDAQGKAQGVNKIPPVSGANEGSGGISYMPFAISPDGTRYYGLSMANMEFINVFAGADQISWLDTFYSRLGGINFPYTTFNPYNSTLLDSTVQGNPFNFGYNINGGWKLIAESATSSGDATQYIANFDVPVTKVTAGNGTYVTLLPVSLNTTNTSGVNIVSDATYGEWTQPHMVIVQQFGNSDGGYGYAINDIRFPYGKKQWLQVDTYASIKRNDNEALNPVSCELITDFGTLQGQLGHVEIPGYGYIPYDNQYRGWLHVANSDHLLQGFVWNGAKYLYLNGAQVTSLLGISVSQIQSIMLDVPLSSLARFN